MKKVGVFVLKLIFMTTLCILLSHFLLMLDDNPYDERFMAEEGRFLLERDNAQDRKQLIQLGKELQLDKAFFYVELQPYYYPKDIHEVLPLQERAALKALTKYYPTKTIETIRAACIKLINHSKEQDVIAALIRLLRTDERKEFKIQAQELVSAHADLFDNQVQKMILELEENKKIPWPKPMLHLSSNQFQDMLLKYIKGDFGVSFSDQQPALNKLLKALPYTLIINGMAMVILLVIGIPLGFYWSKQPNHFWTNFTKQISYFFKVGPNFWLATMVVFIVVYLIGASPFIPFFETRWYVIFPYLILPALIIMLSNLSYIATQVESQVDETKSQAHIRYAMQRKIPNTIIQKKYILREALIRLIPLIGVILPSILIGSVVIEIIFNIPGLGRLSFEAIIQKDWPLIQLFIIMYTTITICSRQLADELQFALDPRTKNAIK